METKAPAAPLDEAKSPSRSSLDQDIPPRERRHLRVIQDEQGRNSLVLNAQLFQQFWANRVTADAANLAFLRLSSGVDLPRVLALTEELLAEDSKLGERFISQSEERIECTAGCNHCCHEPVGVTPPEALLVYAHLEQSRSTEDLALLRQKLSERSEAIRGLTTSERYSPEQPCPLLQEGSCSVYSVRPLACRGMNSLDRADCERRLHDPVRRAEFLRTGQGGRVLVAPLVASQAISVGLQLTLFEQFGLDMRQLDLIWALDLLFSGEQDVAREWAEGQSSFQPALGAPQASPGAPGD